MTISAALVGASSPQLVQIVVSTTTNGVAWTLTGSAAGWAWDVAEGVGDGNQLVVVDIRAPGNMPVTYTYTSNGASQVSTPVTVIIDGDVAFQSFDGQRTVTVNFRDGSLGLELAPAQAVFAIPGRRLPVVRYTATSSGAGAFGFQVPFTDSDAFDALIADGAPVLYRAGVSLKDFPPVAAVLFTRLSSEADYFNEFREWSVSFLFVPDPYLDTILGAFTWDYVDSVLAGRTWDQVDALFAGYTWDQIDTLDWTTA